MHSDQKQSGTLGWLTAVPPNDSNYQGALRRATDAELEMAIEIMSSKVGNKTRILTLQRELRKRQRIAKAQAPAE